MGFLGLRVRSRVAGLTGFDYDTECFYGLAGRDCLVEW